MPYANWAAVTRDLENTLGRLADYEFLILGEPTPAARPPRELFVLPSEPCRTRYVQVLRLGEVLSAECVGAVSQGGACEMSETTVELLRSLGWIAPEECRAEFGGTTTNFGLFVDLAAVLALPGMLVASLALLGCRPQELVLECSGDAAALAQQAELRRHLPRRRAY